MNGAINSQIERVVIGEEQPIVVSGMSFGDSAERIAKLDKGDALSVTGSLKPSVWNDKATGEQKHGLSLTVANALTVYDIRKKRKESNSEQHRAQEARTIEEFADEIPF
jgi:single-strand DNA-binding protein